MQSLKNKPTILLGDNIMKKQIIAVAVAGAVAGVPAIAAADVTLFGQFKYEVGLIEDTNGDSNLHHSYRGTRFGVKGSEDLGGGLEGIFQMRGNISASGRATAKNFSFNEEVWAGLRGGFGTLKLGRSNTAVKNASKPFRAFTDTLADNVTRPTRWQRADGIHYTTPNFSGLTFGGTIEPTGDETDLYYAVNAIYRSGPLYLSAAYEEQEESDGGRAIPVDQGIQDGNLWQVGAAYNYGMGTIGLQYQDWDSEVDYVTVPATFDVTPMVTLRGTLQYRDWDEDDATNWALGAQYNFSKRTELFANIWQDGEVFSQIAFDALPDQYRGRATPSTSATGAPTDDEVNFGVGVRHSF